MSRTCIICGVAANSREHVFPAALGGRRTNKGIYCEKHNNAYSDLADIIVDQLRFFNSQLGVVGDHQRVSGAVTPVLLIDPAINAYVRLSDRSANFVAPRILTPQDHAEGGCTFVLAANSPDEAETFVAEMRRNGAEISIDSVGKQGIYYLGTLDGKFELGGTETGLRSLAYIAQTFLAHTFPDLARLPELAALKEYTLTGSGANYAWWQSPIDDGLEAVSKPFAHRVIVGHNADDGMIYARISLYSAFHFGVALGVVPTTTSRSVVFDIDPLAKHEPHDVQQTKYEDAVGYVQRPHDLTANHLAAIKSGQAQAAVVSLMQRIQVQQLKGTATKWLQELARVKPVDQESANLFFERLVFEESARVLLLTETFQHDFSDFTAGIDNVPLATLSSHISAHCDRDPNSVDGLSVYGRTLLKTACVALQRQLSEDFFRNQLDQDRMEMLMGGGLGLHTVGVAILDQVSQDVFGQATSESDGQIAS